MLRKTLLLNSNYEIISFINEKRAFKLLWKDKVEIISSWNESVSWISGKIKHPSVIRMKYLIKRNFYNFNFNRNIVIKRDNSLCQYCGKKLSNSQITMDHVIPKVQGGSSSFNNCVVACHYCNNNKGARTPEQAGMKLIKKPIHPEFTNNIIINDDHFQYWHEDWDQFLPNF